MFFTHLCESADWSQRIKLSQLKPTCVSVLSCSSEQVSSKSTYSHVAHWADKYLDSGVSLPMDTAESSGSDYDSDDSRSSLETVHHSYSYVPSDVEVRTNISSNNGSHQILASCWAVRSLAFFSCLLQISEVKSEAAVSVAPSKASSIASSLRRRLSAFSTRVKWPPQEALIWWYRVQKTSADF